LIVALRLAVGGLGLLSCLIGLLLLVRFRAAVGLLLILLLVGLGLGAGFLIRLSFLVGLLAPDFWLFWSFG
jgi:hypothetical protein